MRIGMMADTYKPHVSGVTNHIELTKRYLERAGHEVYVFTFGDLEFQDDEERVIRSPGLPLADTGFYLSLRYSRKARELLQSMDIVHVHHPFLSGRLALHYCRPKNIPVIFTNHTRYDLYAQAYMPVVPEQISHGLLQAYLPDFCKEVDLVISPSQGMKKVLENLGVKSHIEVVPNGVDLQQFHNATPLPREKYGFTKNDILLVYAGRIAPEKSLDLLLQSFTGVAQAIENAYLLIIGRGQEQYENELKNLTNELGLQDRLRFTGLVSYEDLPSHLAMCDIFVTASITEVHPLSIIEAMGAGLPIMGINSVGVGDTVEDGKTGFLADDNIASFTAKLTRLCLEPNLRAQMGRSAREASSAYDIERTTRIMLGHYERLSRVKQKRKKIDWEERLRRILEEFQS